MKASAWVLAAALGFTSTAQAATLSCFDPQTVDHGFTIELNEARDSAVIREASLAGPKDVATVPCSRIESDPLKAAPAQDTLKCQSKDTVDHGYVVTIRSASCAGEVTAKLEELSLAGPKLVGELVCQELAEQQQEPK